MRGELLFYVFIVFFLTISCKQQSIEKTSTYDLVVYGGTPAGIMSAIQASKMGKKAVIIEPGFCLGGAVTGGLSHSDIGNKETIGGLSLEFFGTTQVI